MDRSQLQMLVNSATAGLSQAQQLKLKKMLGDPKALEQLQRRVSDQDISSLEKNLSSPEALQNFLRSSDVQKRIDEIL